MQLFGSRIKCFSHLGMVVSLKGGCELKAGTQPPMTLGMQKSTEDVNFFWYTSLDG